MKGGRVHGGEYHTHVYVYIYIDICMNTYIHICIVFVLFVS